MPKSGDPSSVLWTPNLDDVDRRLIPLEFLLTAEELEPEECVEVDEAPPTPDSIAYYLPWHLGGDEYWGIYFRRSRMQHYVERIQRQFGLGDLRASIIEQVFWHEMEHFEQEKAVTALEDLLGEVIFPDWLEDRYYRPVRLLDRKSGQAVEIRLIEEALATAREIEWAELAERKGMLPTGYKEFMEMDSRRKSPGYRSFYLCLGEEAKQEARAGFLESVGSRAQRSMPYRLTRETAKRLFGTRTSKRNAVPIYLVDH